LLGFEPLDQVVGLLFFRDRVHFYMLACLATAGLPNAKQLSRLCFEWPPGADGPDNVEIVDYD
jgi:hypothetical protein